MLGWCWSTDAGCAVHRRPRRRSAVRKNFGTRLSQFPKIDEVVKTPLAGLYEVRTGNEVMYTDEQGNIIDARTSDDVALARNKAFGEKHRVRGTPAVVFEDGTRIPGAMSLEALERRLAAASKKG